MISFDVMKYGTNAAIGYVGIMAYDVFIDVKNYRDAFTMADASTFAIASIASDMSYELLSNVIPYINDGSFLGMVAHPLLQGLIYSYLYDSMVNKSYPYNRDNLKAFYLGSILSLLSSYAKNPILSLFGMRQYN